MKAYLKTKHFIGQTINVKPVNIMIILQHTYIYTYIYIVASIKIRIS